MKQPPRNPEIEAARRAILDVFLANAKSLAEALIEQAMQGDMKAIRLGLGYILGQPRQTMEVAHSSNAPVQLELDLLTDEQLNTLEAIVISAEESKSTRH